LRHTDFFELQAVNPFAPTARRAIVVDKPFVFGTARMWATINHPEPGEHMQVFKDETEARQWVTTDLPFPVLSFPAA
jgi:hypothetical protein